MKRLRWILTACLLLASPYSLAVDAQRQFNILSNIEQHTAQLKQDMTTQTNDKDIIALRDFHRQVLKTSEVDPTQGQWKGDFVRSLKDRRSVEGNWSQIKKILAGYPQGVGFKPYQQAVEQYLTHRKDGSYDESIRLAQGTHFQSLYRNLLKGMKHSQDSKKTLDEEQLAAYVLNLRDLLQDLEKMSQPPPEKLEPNVAMSLSAKSGIRDNPRNADKAGDMADSKAMFLVFGFLLCVLVLGLGVYKRLQQDAPPRAVVIKKSELGSPESASKPAAARKTSSKTTRLPKSYSLKVECIHRLSDQSFQNSLLQCLKPLDPHSSEYASSKNIILTRVNGIITDISQCRDDDWEDLRTHLKANFKTLQSYVKALRTGPEISQANTSIIAAFRLILGVLRDLGQDLKQNTGDTAA
ncbi:hypothetical protein [Pseudobacteriovorax antillogorgiicola]|uniref:Uncharacterized protein n=1 Tax=Pseudobacteriovorax antillogorgiicola TaxID=1513793 RepID=A0A1Y6BV23_9BACT|nr:hypothetical protein [Pseudobacteriovorax antillogorgiicola]TCS52428.1 hypothetical protein EDD56_109173 [Pseudobacteriovorax antillogorgiicola]SMF28741.1 hypothetical protein SAMN06296036_10940 [Pseudobacteriovorax antillogorgiicola]